MGRAKWQNLWNRLSEKICARTIEDVCKQIGNISNLYAPQKCQNRLEATAYPFD